MTEWKAAEVTKAAMARAFEASLPGGTGGRGGTGFRGCVGCHVSSHMVSSRSLAICLALLRSLAGVGVGNKTLGECIHHATYLGTKP